MDIVIIGSGNTAAVLGRKFRAAGHTILQVVARNSSAASALAYEWDTVSTNYKSPITRDAEVYIIAVSDEAINDVTDDMRLPGKVVAHTAASVPKEVLEKVTEHYGVFYPLQSLRKDNPLLPDTPVFIDGSDALTRKKLEKLAHSISSEHVKQAESGDLLKLHVAAVVVSNFTNHLYALAEDYCLKEGISFRELIPLIEETATRLKDSSPRNAQTGPALRHDKETIERHIELLKEHPHLKNIYILLTESIQQIKA
jgi:predicted short-subunit dehydrogenase-like oxidoreductase (DUF2520 family)